MFGVSEQRSVVLSFVGMIFSGTFFVPMALCATLAPSRRLFLFSKTTENTAIDGYFVLC